MLKESAAPETGSDLSDQRKRSKAAIVGALMVALLLILVIGIGCLVFGDYPPGLGTYLKVVTVVAFLSLFVLVPYFFGLLSDALLTIKPVSSRHAGSTEPPQLVELAAFYDRARREPEAISDEEFLANIGKALWPTNRWSYVEEAFAIIAPGCALRPHLVRELIASPIAAMIPGGLDGPGEIIAQGVACATKEKPYVKPSEEGRQWLLNEWPKYAPLAEEIFQEIWRELEEGGGINWMPSVRRLLQHNLDETSPDYDLQVVSDTIEDVFVEYRTEDISGLVEKLVRQQMLTVSQAHNIISVAIWSGGDNGSSLLKSLNQWLRDCDDTLRIELALHTGIYPFKNGTEMRGVLGRVMEKFPEHAGRCRELINSRQNS